MQKPRMPSGFGTSGQKLWKSVVGEFDLNRDPHKLEILAQACRVSDQITELDGAAVEAPLTVKGSMGQPVISPFIAEARVQRALLAQLIARLNLAELEEDEDG